MAARPPACEFVIMRLLACEITHDNVHAMRRRQGLHAVLIQNSFLAFLHPATRELDGDCTSPQRNTHISESQTVRYPWHPWRDRCVFIDEVIDRNGLVYFRCRVDETLHQPALEIPDWMFDSAWSTVCLIDSPIVGWEALRSLKLVLAAASSHDPVVKEAQGFEGGTDATDTESKTISIGTVPSINSDSPVGNNAIGVEAKGRSTNYCCIMPDFASTCFFVLLHKKRMDLPFVSICRNLLRVASSCVLHLARIWQSCFLQ
jgi:hypothetical protein